MDSNLIYILIGIGVISLIGIILHNKIKRKEINVQENPIVEKIFHYGIDYEDINYIIEETEHIKYKKTLIKIKDQLEKYYKVLIKTKHIDFEKFILIAEKDLSSLTYFDILIKNLDNCEFDKNKIINLLKNEENKIKSELKIIKNSLNSNFLQ